MSISNIIKNLLVSFAKFHRLTANALGKSSLCANPFFHIFFFGGRRGGDVYFSKSSRAYFLVMLLNKCVHLRNFYFSVERGPPNPLL